MALDENVQLADVVVATGILDVTIVKRADSGDKYSTKGYPANPVLVNRAKAAALDETFLKNWQATCKKKIRGIPSSKPQIHFGPVACTSGVAASKPLKKRLKRLNKDLLAVEMESAGVFQAVLNSFDPGRIMMVRGISDPAEEKAKQKLDKQQHWRTSSSFNSAAFVINLIRRGTLDHLNVDTFTIDFTRSRGLSGNRSWVKKKPGYSFPIFENLIVPRGPITQLVCELKAFAPKGRKLPIMNAQITYTSFASSGRATKSRISVEGFHDGLLRFSLGPLAATPLGVALEVKGQPSSLVVGAATPVEARDESYNFATKNNREQ